MKLQNITNIFKSLSLNPLFGEAAHKILAPYVRETAKEVLKSNRKVILASTLLLLYTKNNEVYFTLIKRAAYNGTHGGQISFPGGKVEQNETPEEAAIRETHEEIGIAHSKIKVITALTPLYIPPSNMLVYPYIGYLNSDPYFQPDPREVDRIIEVKLSDLLDEKMIKTKKVKVGKFTQTPLKIEVPYFNLKNETVWGATAMILSEVKEILKIN